MRSRSTEPNGVSPGEAGSGWDGPDYVGGGTTLGGILAFREKMF